MSRHIGTDHHELILPADVLDRVEDLAPSLDEPIADSAILPTFLLAQFARQSVKVVLTGEGADELFAGYGRYKAAYLSERLEPLMPNLVRRLGWTVGPADGTRTALPRASHDFAQEWGRKPWRNPRQRITGRCMPSGFLGIRTAA